MGHRGMGQAKSDLDKRAPVAKQVLHVQVRLHFLISEHFSRSLDSHLAIFMKVTIFCRIVGFEIIIGVTSHETQLHPGVLD